LFKQACKFKVTNRLLRRLEILYTTSEDPPNELILQKNPLSFKFEWNVCIPSKILEKSLSKYSKRQSIKQLDE